MTQTYTPIIQREIYGRKFKISTPFASSLFFFYFHKNLITNDNIKVWGSIVGYNNKNEKLKKKKGIWEEGHAIVDGMAFHPTNYFKLYIVMLNPQP
jgi:hypothetical protein